jgi:hypothetical protein
MDLIERYLSAVRMLLPAGQRDDIAAELRDVLMNRREEKAAELGRLLTRPEDEALLKDFGNPLAVAARYGRQQHLIGPELYPVYLLVLKIVLAVIAGSALITGVVNAVLAHGDPGPAIRAAVGVAWTGLFAAVGAVTVVFAILDRTDVRRKFLDNWNPRDLPRLPPRHRRRRATWVDHVAGIVVNIIFILWWTRAIQLWQPNIPLKAGQSLNIDLAPIWQGLYWPVLGVSAGVIAVHALKLFAPAPKRAAYALDILLQIAVLVVAGLALRAGTWVLVSGHGLAAVQLADVTLGVNIGFQVTLVVIVVVAAFTIAYDLWRLIRPESEAQARR